MDPSEFESTGYMALKKKMRELVASHPELASTVDTELASAGGKVWRETQSELPRALDPLSCCRPQARSELH
jgi:hypothetical protein